MTKREFIEKAVCKHGDKYDYSLVPDTVAYGDKICVICNEVYPWGEPHGEFIVQAGKHISRGDGCTKCSGHYRRNLEEFIKEATYIHKGVYTYDNFKWNGTHKKGKIHCTKHKIDFEMTPDHHLHGQGCPLCRYEKTSQSKTKTKEEFIEQARKIHGDKYDYSKVNYMKGYYKVCIICKEHGEFWQTPENHIHKTLKQGCPICGRINSDKERTFSTEEFILKCQEKHGNYYDYSKTKYINSNESITITCPKHGDFIQRASNHMNGQGCPKCACFRSKGEREVESFIKELGFGVSTSDRQILSGDELDIVIPEKSIAIEYNGLHWHGSLFKPKGYHLQKSVRCSEAGYRLIHIFEDEWNLKKEIVKSRLKSILGLSDKVIYARKCCIREIYGSVSSDFLNENHLQGKCGSSVKLGLYYENELVSLMTFGKSRHFIGSGKPEWELLRFCNKLNTRVIGGASRLMKHFIEKYRPSEIISYADRRWSDGNLYKVLGFEKYKESKPNYFYIVDSKREHRFKFRKRVLVSHGFDAGKSEMEIMSEHGIQRIYDCGCLCYKINPKYDSSGKWEKNLQKKNS